MPDGPTPELTSAIDSVNGVAGALFHQVASANTGNVLISPLSVTGALHMTMAGAAGDTLTEMRTALSVVGDDATLHTASGALQRSLAAPAAATVDIANRVWVEQTWQVRVRAAYRGTLERAYAVELGSADFAGAPETARAEINGWVAELTRQKIPELIPSGVLDPLTRLVLTNAVYFDGDWAQPFDVARTTDAPFHAPGGDVVAPLMSRVGALRYAESPRWQAAALPYSGGAWEMLVLLPTAGESLEADVGAALQEAAARLGETRVALTLPRFSFRWSGSLVPALRALGMNAAFDRSADFSGMADLTNTDGLYISDVLHEAFIEVDEEGTEAGAATAVVIATRSAAAAPRVIEMRVDRPFFFAIRHVETGALLFVGRVVDPTA
ncbi:MAG: serpin family protein [Myxococcales bacterium]|nr:serpin family protein [Myxococcales bacterium]MCB9532288.1 serpin family protein [Myxococcales bacterium]